MEGDQEGKDEEIVLPPGQGHSRSHISLGQITGDYKSLQLNDGGRANNQNAESAKKSSSLFVAVRCRPLLRYEKNSNLFEIVKVVDGKAIALLDADEFEKDDDLFRLSQPTKKQYTFDCAFGQDASQTEVFESTTKKLVNDIIDGYNATCFAYGATGAGKTYTMLGTMENPGLAFLTLRRLFSAIEDRDDRTYQVKFSYLEIYNEVIRDLLGPDPYQVLDLREDANQGLAVAGLSDNIVESSEQVMKFLFAGNKNRTQEANGTNQYSSRSHAIFQITVEHSDKCAGIQAEVKIGKLSLIDLAGSEKNAHTNNKGVRLIEGANINRSLLALGNCINKLSDQVSKGQRTHIPYRDSKLTRLLKDSLGGNCQTVMIANISPASSCYEDTHNTLKYANRAKNIKTNITKNVINVQFHISQYTQIITQLRQEVVNLKKQLEFNKFNTVKNPSIPQELEDDIERIFSEINAHHTQEGDLRKKLFLTKQKIANLTVTLKNLKAENEGEGQERIKEKEMQLKEAHANYDMFRNKLQEYCTEQEGLMEKIKNKYHNISEKWNSIFNNQIIHEGDLVNQIPIEGEVNLKAAENIVTAQNLAILKMKEQIRLRDAVLDKAREQCQELNIDMNFDDKRLVRYEDMLRLPQEKGSMQGPSFRTPSNNMKNYQSPNEKLFAKVTNIQSPRKQASIESSKDENESKKSQRKEKSGEKRSHSVFSDDTVGNIKKMGAINKIAKRVQAGNKKNKLQNAGAQIVGGYRKYRVERPHYAPLKEIKPSILAKPDKSIFKFLNKNKAEL